MSDVDLPGCWRSLSLGWQEKLGNRCEAGAARLLSRPLSFAASLLCFLYFFFFFFFFFFNPFLPYGKGKRTRLVTHTLPCLAGPTPDLTSFLQGISNRCCVILIGWTAGDTGFSGILSSFFSFFSTVFSWNRSGFEWVLRGFIGFLLPTDFYRVGYMSKLNVTGCCHCHSFGVVALIWICEGKANSRRCETSAPSWRPTGRPFLAATSISSRFQTNRKSIFFFPQWNHARPADAKQNKKHKQHR